MTKKTETKSPLKRQPNRLPGQSVDDKITKLRDQANESLVFIVTMGAFILWSWFVYLREAPVNPATMTVAGCLAIAWSVYRLIPLVRKITFLRLGRDGERAVGQFLERTRSMGYHVYHDLQFEEGNIDHLLVGPGGIFTVETKTWSKPARGKAVIKYNAIDRTLAKGQFDVSEILDQANAQANAIRHLVAEYAANIKPKVRPVIVFPGWYIESSRTEQADVWVLEAKALPKWISNCYETVTPEQVGHLRQILDQHAARTR